MLPSMMFRRRTNGCLLRKKIGHTRLFLGRCKEIFIHTVGALVLPARAFGKRLFWLFVLDLLEAPLFWKKVAAGIKLVWVGYQMPRLLHRD